MKLNRSQLFYLRRSSSYVNHPARFYLSWLFFFTFLGFIAWLLIATDMSQTWMGPEAKGVVMVILLVMIINNWGWAGMHHEASKSMMAYFNHYGLTTGDKFLVAKDETTQASRIVSITRYYGEGKWKNKLRVIQLWMGGLTNGIEKWPGADGGVTWPAWAACFAHIREYFDPKADHGHGAWVPFRAWSLNKGVILEQGYTMSEIVKIIEECKDLKDLARTISTMAGRPVANRPPKWSTPELIKIISRDMPFVTIGPNLVLFPFNFEGSFLEYLPSQLEELLKSTGRVNKNTPVLVGYDVAMSWGGPGTDGISQVAATVADLEAIGKKDRMAILQQRRQYVQLEDTRGTLDEKSLEDEIKSQ